MTWPEDQIEELKQISQNIQMAEEGGFTFFLMTDVLLPDGCSPARVDVLLCPMPRDGYTSRLFFAQKIQSSKALNWNSVDQRILEKLWYAYSWKINRTDLRLAQMIVDHLRALR